MGIVALGDGKGNFAAISSVNSGFKVNGDAKALAKIKSTGSEHLFVATQNQDSVRVFRTNESRKLTRFFDPLPMDSYAELHHENGRLEKVEFYYGSGYLSQSSRNIEVPSTVKKITVHDFKGNRRILEYSPLALE